MAFMTSGNVPNVQKRGLRFPALRLGAYSVNLVLQASSCCGADNETQTWTADSLLGLVGPDDRTSTQKRLGLEGTDALVGTGLHRRGNFVGSEGALDKRPQILGFVFKDGRMTLFRNGVKVDTYSAQSTAFSTLSWINGWLDENANSTGQIAEVKLYNVAHSDSVMARLHRLLECKWHVGAAQTDDWKTCEHAEGVGEGGEVPGPMLGKINIQNMDGNTNEALAPALYPIAFGTRLMTAANGQPDYLGESENALILSAQFVAPVYFLKEDGTKAFNLTVGGGAFLYPYETAVSALGPYEPVGAPLIIANGAGTFPISYTDESSTVHTRNLVVETGAIKAYMSTPDGALPTSDAGWDYGTIGDATGSAFTSDFTYKEVPAGGRVAFRRNIGKPNVLSGNFDVPFSVVIDKEGLELSADGVTWGASYAPVTFTVDLASDPFDHFLADRSAANINNSKYYIKGSNGRIAERNASNAAGVILLAAEEGLPGVLSVPDTYSLISGIVAGGNTFADHSSGAPRTFTQNLNIAGGESCEGPTPGSVWTSTVTVTAPGAAAADDFANDLAARNYIESNIRTGMTVSQSGSYTVGEVSGGTSASASTNTNSGTTNGTQLSPGWGNPVVQSAHPWSYGLWVRTLPSANGFDSMWTGSVSLAYGVANKNSGQNLSGANERPSACSGGDCTPCTECGSTGEGSNSVNYGGMHIGASGNRCNMLGVNDCRWCYAYSWFVGQGRSQESGGIGLRPSMPVSQAVDLRKRIRQTR